MLQSKTRSEDQQKVVERSCDPATCKHCPLNNPLVEAMKKSMSDELEQRRLAWEKDVIRLQEDFFKVKLGHVSSETGAEPLAIEHTGSGTGTASHQNESDLLFVLRFNVKNCKPEDISIRAESDKLTVSAKYIQEEGASQKIIKQFNKQVDIPSNVNIEKMISYLSADGILTVEAPKLSSHLAGEVCPHHHSNPALMSTSSVKNNTENKILPFSNTIYGNETSLVPAVPMAGLTDIYETDYGPMLALNVDLGSQCYLPKEVKVQVYQNKISVSASHEESSEGRSSKKEFQREFAIPEPIELQTFKAVLDTSRGVVFIGASFVSNTKHNMVNCLVMKQMPMLGKQCNVEQCY